MVSVFDKIENKTPKIGKKNLTNNLKLEHYNEYLPRDSPSTTKSGTKITKDE